MARVLERLPGLSDRGRPAILFELSVADIRLLVAGAVPAAVLRPDLAPERHAEDAAGFELPHRKLSS